MRKNCLPDQEKARPERTRPDAALDGRLDVVLEAVCRALPSTVLSERGAEDLLRHMRHLPACALETTFGFESRLSDPPARLATFSWVAAPGTRFGRYLVERGRPGTMPRHRRPHWAGTLRRSGRPGRLPVALAQRRDPGVRRRGSAAPSTGAAGCIPRSPTGRTMMPTPLVAWDAATGEARQPGRDDGPRCQRR